MPDATNLARRRAARFLSVGLVIATAPLLARAAEVKLDGRTFTLPDGFTIERVAGPPLVNRPIEADFDEQGRLYVTDAAGAITKPEVQRGDPAHRVVRLEDTDADGRFDKQTLFADKMPFPEGGMWQNGALFVAAPPIIWKLSDPAGTGVVISRHEWFNGKTLTGCANDLHGPYAGPDGWIYWCKGAFAEQTYPRPGRKPLVTRASHLMRSRPDGTGVEAVMTGGMDNPVGVAFTPGGERIVSATFLQHPAGGRRDGLIHAVYGGVYGKVHDVIDNHPRTSPDVMPVLSHLGPAAVAGLTRYESDAFGPEYLDNLFSACFNLRKVTRHVLTPDGATFKSRDSDFVVCDDLDFHPTDVLEDADGSLLIIDTGGWYKLCCPTSQLDKPDALGAIYRVRRVDAPKIDDPRGLKLNWDALAADELVKLLDNPRAAVRKRAISEVGAKGAPAVKSLNEALTSPASVRLRLNAVWALTRIDHPQARASVRGAWGDNSEDVRQAVAHSVSTWRDVGAAGFTDVLTTDGLTPANRRVAEALGRIVHRDGLFASEALAALLAALADTRNDRVLDHSLTYALIEIGDADAVRKGLANDSPRVRRAAMIALDQMEDARPDAAAVAAALADPDAGLRATAAWIAARHPEWGGQLVEAFRKRLAAPNHTDADRAELQAQLASLAKSTAMQDLLAEEMTRADAPADRRRLALRAAADAGLKETPSTWIKAIGDTLASADPAFLSDGAAAVARLKLSAPQSAELRGTLLKLADRDDLSPAIRLQALDAATPPGKDGGAINAGRFAFLLSQLAPAAPATQRLAAAQLVARLALSRDQLLLLAIAFREAGPLEIDRLLIPFERGGGDAEVGETLVLSLLRGKGARSLRPDALRRALAKFDAEARAAAEPLLATLAPDAAKQKARLDDLLAALPAGDVRRGRAVFNSQKTGCVACHAIGYVGGTIGPDLTRIGQTRGRRDLLESILFPSASFVQSYEPVIVVVTNGDNQAGLVRRSDAEEVVLVTGPQQEVHIPRAKVKEIRPSAVSIMPQGLDEQLSKQELSDLVAFLMAAK